MLIPSLINIQMSLNVWNLRKSLLDCYTSNSPEIQTFSPAQKLEARSVFVAYVLELSMPAGWTSHQRHQISRCSGGRILLLLMEFVVYIFRSSQWKENFFLLDLGCRKLPLLDWTPCWRIKAADKTDSCNIWVVLAPLWSKLHIPHWPLHLFMRTVFALEPVESSGECLYASTWPINTAL